MNIVFFGTNEFSATVAEALLKSEHKILAIVAQYDHLDGVIYTDKCERFLKKDEQ